MTTYTKKKKISISGRKRNIYTKKNSRKEYIKSKGRMVNLKTYLKRLKIKKGGSPNADQLTRQRSKLRKTFKGNSITTAPNGNIHESNKKSSSAARARDWSKAVEEFTLRLDGSSSPTSPDSPSLPPPTNNFGTFSNTSGKPGGKGKSRKSKGKSRKSKKK